MITSPEDYLKLLYQIQNDNRQTQAILLPKDETIYEIDLNTRTIQAPEFLSVEKDHVAETIYFKVDRYYDNMDLTNTVCLVQYVNENAKTNDNVPAEGFAYAVPFFDVDHFKDENKILFPWMIGGPATVAAGPVKFAVKFYLLDKEGQNFIYDLNTQPAISKILYGMDVINDNNENFVIPANIAEDLYQKIEELKGYHGTYWVDLS